MLRSAAIESMDLNLGLGLSVCHPLLHGPVRFIDLASMRSDAHRGIDPVITLFFLTLKSIS
jgi:hypothetical protein